LQRGTFEPHPKLERGSPDPHLLNYQTKFYSAAKFSR